MIFCRKGSFGFVLRIIVLLILSCVIPAVGATRIMPLGDSITKGSGSTNGWGYRKPLYDLLTSGGYSFDFVGSIADGNFPEPNHEGRNGWRADEILNGRTSEPNAGKLEVWLDAYQPSIVLLHIGTNDITAGGNMDQDINEVNAILDVIDDYEEDANKEVTVILALIINRRTYSPATTQFNADVNVMAQNRIAGGDDIIIVDMESALNYTMDMSDEVHPNDNGYAKMAAVWYGALDGFFKELRDSLEEINQRLELRASGNLAEFSDFYNANGWSINTAEDIEISIDFHYSDISAPEGWIGFSIGDDANYVSMSVGSGSHNAYFYYETVVDGNVVDVNESRTADDGTLYVSFDSASRTFYLSHVGFGSGYAYTSAQGQWGQPVEVSISGGSAGAILGSGRAYLDNFRVNKAGLLNWPPPTDLDDNGYIELNDFALMAENWLGSGDADFDNSGVVDFLDYTEFCLAW